MGMIERFGRIADTYISERDKLLEADKERRRTFTGHPFWPTEVLRDTIIFASIVMTIAFYSWLIPPPLHSAADPFAQAGFVFPDWYVLFSYGYLRWGEYLPQFVIPAGPIGEFLGAPVIDWNAAWWGAAITGLPVGILALPPFLPGREKRGVEDPWFATAGAVYLAHVWFISVFSINIFLDLYAKDRSDYCFLGSHSELMCGRQAPWTAEVFNAVPWILTGIFLFAMIYFPTRKFLLNSVGSRVTPRIGRQVAVGSLIAAVLISVVTWPIYENGFWDYGGLGAMDDLEDLDALRAQPSDTLVHVEEGNVWGQWEDECIPYEESQGLAAWNSLAEGEDVADWCVIAAVHWSEWGIYQPTKFKIIDFNGDNGHADSETGRNSADDRASFFGLEDGSEVIYSSSFTFEVEDLGVSEVPTDIGCLFRTSVRNAGTHTQSLILTDSSGSEVWRADGCISESIYLDSGQSYTVNFQTTSQGINDSVEVITVISYQPLLLNEDGTAVVRSESPMDLETLSPMYMKNPTFEKNPKLSLIHI